MSVRRQCELLGLSRSSLYYEPAAETAENLRLMRLIDEEYTAHPFLGSRRLTKWLVEQGEEVNRKRVQRLMRVMGLEAIYPKPKLSAAGRGHRIYPYLLRDVRIERPDQVWSTDITYVPLAHGFMYLAAIIDWFSRYVLAWRLSNTLDGSFCLEMLEEALGRGRPEVFNTDQGRAVHGSGVDGSAGVGGGGGEHGRQGPLPGQRVRGAAVADGEVRGHLPVAVRGRCRSCGGGWGVTSRTTTRSGCIRRWTTGRRRPCMGRGDPGGGRRGEGEAFFFAPPSLSPGEGRAVRKRMPRSRGDGQRRGRAEFSRTVAKEGTFLV